MSDLLAPPRPSYACLCRPPVRPPRGEAAAPADATASQAALVRLAETFSPRYEIHGDDLVVLDISGLERLFRTPGAIGDELMREASAGGVRVQVAVATTGTAARLLAQVRPGLTVVEPGGDARALAPLPIGLLAALVDRSAHPAFAAVAAWGLRTLGEFAALPPADLTARIGRHALAWQALARGEDIRPLVPARPDERFESTLELEWPIEGLEPLSFVLTRLLEPLSIRLERRDRGAAVLHVVLRLVTKEVFTRRLQLPTPLRDVRTLRTLALLDLGAHPPPAAIERVAIVIDPTPGRVLQHTLFTRPHPTPEALSTLLARLGALMGQDRVGGAAAVDSYRPGAFAMRPFATEHDLAPPARADGDLLSALRRCRQPVPARVVVERGRPVEVTTDRRGFAGGAVLSAAGPWRTSGAWWSPAGRHESHPGRQDRPAASQGTGEAPWNRDEWEVALGDGGVYRIFQDRLTNGWFVDAIVD